MNVPMPFVGIGLKPLLDLSGPTNTGTGNCSMPRIIARFHCIALLLCAGEAVASTLPDVLPVDEAFGLSAQRDAGRLHIRFRVAPGYYLYKARMSVESATGSKVGFDELPAGQKKDDPHFGLVEVFVNRFEAWVQGRAVGEVFTIHYQGCADEGFCYPPQRRDFAITYGDTSLYISQDPSLTRGRMLPF